MVSPSDSDKTQIIALRPRYIPLIQKPTCCAVTCLQMVLYRNGFGLLDQEELAIQFGVKIHPDNVSAFSSAMPVMTRTNFDEGIATIESEGLINSFFEKKGFNLRAKSHKRSHITSTAPFIEENIRKNYDVWIEYHAHEIHRDDEEKGNYVHDGLIESINAGDAIVSLIDPVPKHKQRISVSLDVLDRSISNHFGRETGFVIITKG